MSKISNRFGLCISLLSIAAGATALAGPLVVQPTSITLDAYRSTRVTAVVEGSPNKPTVTHEDCIAKRIANIDKFTRTDESGSGTGRPAKEKHAIEFTLRANGKAGDCSITIAAGPESRTIPVRVLPEKE